MIINQGMSVLSASLILVLVLPAVESAELVRDHRWNFNVGEHRSWSVAQTGAGKPVNESIARRPLMRWNGHESWGPPTHHTWGAQGRMQSTEKAKRNASLQASNVHAEPTPHVVEFPSYLGIVIIRYQNQFVAEKDISFRKGDKEDTITVKKVQRNGPADMQGVRGGMDLLAIKQGEAYDTKSFKKKAVDEIWADFDPDAEMDLTFGRPPPPPTNTNVIVGFSVAVTSVLGICIYMNYKHWKEDWAEDPGTEEHQIVSYDSDEVTYFGVMVRLFSKGSLFANPKVWKQVFGHVLVYAFLTCLLAQVLRSASRLNAKEMVTISKYMNAFLPFLFAMYLSTVFGRWWTMRTAGIGQMWQVVDDLCILMAVNCPGEKFKAQKDAMLRYGLLCQALIYQIARNPTPTEQEKKENMDQLVKEKWLTEQERPILESSVGNKAQTVWVWILDLWAGLYKDKHIEWFCLSQASSLVVEGRRAVKVVFTHLTCQLPFGWVHLITCMLNLTIIILICKCAIVSAKTFAVMAHAPSPCAWTDNGIQCAGNFTPEINLVSQWIQIVILPLLYLGFLEFTNELTNPFGIDPHDFPRLKYMAGMRAENQGFYSVQGKSKASGGGDEG